MDALKMKVITSIQFMVISYLLKQHISSELRNLLWVYSTNVQEAVRMNGRASSRQLYNLLQNKTMSPRVNYNQ